MSDIEPDGAEDFTGAAAGEDIPRLTGAGDFSEMLYEVDYVTAEPVGTVPTGVYSLKAWVSHYNTNTYKGRTSTGRRRHCKGRKRHPAGQPESGNDGRSPELPPCSGLCLP